MLRLGEADWRVVSTPGHTAGHLSLWQPEERLLVVGDSLSDYDVGRVASALDGHEATATALASLQRLFDGLAARSAVVRRTAGSGRLPSTRVGPGTMRVPFSPD